MYGYWKTLLELISKRASVSLELQVLQQHVKPGIQGKNISYIVSKNKNKIKLIKNENLKTVFYFKLGTTRISMINNLKQETS